MITRVDPRLRREAEEFGLKFTCESCAHFDPEPRRCANGYPTAPHCAVDLAVAETLLFCKGFELG